MELTRRHAIAGSRRTRGRTANYLTSRRGSRPSQTSRRRASIATRSATSWYRRLRRQVYLPADGRFIPNAKKEEVNAALEKAFMPRDMVTIYFAPLVIKSGGKVIVIDTGMGPEEGRQQGR